MAPPFDMVSNILPPREAWRLKVGVLRAWIVPSFVNQDVSNSMEFILVDEDSTKIQATIKKQLLNRFKDHVVEGQVYRMAYFSVVDNAGSYRATTHNCKLLFLYRTNMVTVEDNVIPKTCFSFAPLSDLIQMTAGHNYLML